MATIAISLCPVIAPFGVCIRGFFTQGSLLAGCNNSRAYAWLALTCCDPITEAGCSRLRGWFGGNSGDKHASSRWTEMFLRHSYPGLSCARRSSLAEV